MDVDHHSKIAVTDIELGPPAVEDEKEPSVTHYETSVSETGVLDYVVDHEAERRSVCTMSWIHKAHSRYVLRLVRRIDIRMVSGSTMMYMLCFIDRFNIVRGQFSSAATAAHMHFRAMQKFSTATPETPCSSLSI